MNQKSIREGYGDALVQLGQKHLDVVALDADLAHATASFAFSKEFPDRFYNMGIAEQNMLCVAAGMAHSGLVPFASSFAIFAAGRGYEQIRNGICYSNANVKISGGHAGITAFGDGGTHQCVEDLALMRVLPNIIVLSPGDYYETIRAVHAAYAHQGPVYIRICRQPFVPFLPQDVPFKIGKAVLLGEGNDVAMVTTGYMTHVCLAAASILAQEDIHATVVHLPTIKPLDEQTILEVASRCRRVITVEEHSIIGGLGEAVASCLLGRVALNAFRRIGIEDRFGQTGSLTELLEEYGLSETQIAHACRAAMA